MPKRKDNTVIGLFVFVIWALVWLRVPFAISAIRLLLDSDREYITKGGVKHGND